jgi:hypothetical protein
MRFSRITLLGVKGCGLFITINGKSLGDLHLADQRRRDIVIIAGASASVTQAIA